MASFRNRCQTGLMILHVFGASPASHAGSIETQSLERLVAERSSDDFFSLTRFVHGDVIHTDCSEVSARRMSRWQASTFGINNSTFSSSAWYKSVRVHGRQELDLADSSTGTVATAVTCAALRSGCHSTPPCFASCSACPGYLRNICSSFTGGGGASFREGSDVCAGCLLG